MKILNKQISGGILAFAFVLAFVPMVGAQENATDPVSPDTATTNERTQQQRQVRETEPRETREVRAQRVERSIERCAQIETRLNDRTAKTTELKEAHITRYDRMLERLDVVIASAEVKSYDSAALVAARATVVEKIDAYEAAIEAYEVKLGTTRAVACGQEPTAYGRAIVDSRDSLLAARNASLDIRTAFRELVVVELRAFKLFLEQNTTNLDGESR
jgi:hypothetical protein